MTESDKHGIDKLVRQVSEVQKCLDLANERTKGERLAGQRGHPMQHNRCLRKDERIHSTERA